MRTNTRSRAYSAAPLPEIAPKPRSPAPEPTGRAARIRARVQRDSQYASVSHFIRLAIERTLQADP